MKVELNSRFSPELVDEVLDGSLDLAFVTEPPDSPLLTRLTISESPFYIAMSKKDGLAGSPSAIFESLSNHCWILFERRLHPPLYDEIMHLAKQKCALPKRIRHITTPEEAFPFVEEGECVAFVEKSGALLLARNGVTVRPLAVPELTLKTYLVSRTDNETKLLSEFVRAFMRKLLPVKKDVQRSLPMAGRQLA